MLRSFINKYRKWFPLALWGAGIISVLLIFLTNTLYVTYPDEFVNILGGKFINEGRIPYKDFFDHHMPFAWYFAAILLRISFHSYVLFRVWWALFLFGGLLGLGIYFKRNRKEIFPYYAIYFLLYPLITVFLWMHLYLSDSLAFYFFSLIFWLLLAETYAPEVNKKVLFISSFLVFLLVFSSMTYVYVSIFVYLWLLYLLCKKKFDFKEVLHFAVVCTIPYVVFGLYLILSGSLYDFYMANIYYNSKLYIDIPNYTRGNQFNPLKFALTLIFNFHENFLVQLARVKDFELFLPIGPLLALGSLLFMFLLFFENKLLFVLYFFMLSFSSPRANVNKLEEMNYQAAVYVALGFISALVVLWRSEKIVFKTPYLEMFRKVCLFFLFVNLLFTGLFLAKSTYEKFYLRYTQKMPGIYDLAPVGRFINETLTTDDYYWIGPYEPNELYYVKTAKLPGKYISLLPQFREDEYFSKAFLRQMEEHPPTYIIYKHDASIFMTPAIEFGKFFLKWMDGKYTKVEKMKNVTVVGFPEGFDLRMDMYVLNSQKERVLGILRSKGYIL